MHKKRSIFINKQVYSYSIVIIAMVFIFFFTFYYYITQTSEEISTLTKQELANKTLKQVESYLDDIDNVAYQVMINSSLLNTFSNLQKNKNTENYFDKNIMFSIDTGSILTTINGPKISMWRISVYNQNGDYISTGAMPQKERINNVLNSEDILAKMKDLMNSPDKNSLIPPQADKWSDMYSSKYITVYRPIMNIYTKEVYGVVEVQQDIKKLIKNIVFSNMKYINILISDNNGRKIFSTANETKNDDDINKVSRTSQKYKWTVTLSQKKSDMLQPYKPLIETVLIGSIGVIVFMIVVVLLIARKLSKPLITLKNTVSQITIENMPDTFMAKDNIDEVRELNIAFSSMLNRLSDSIALEKKASLLALQSQMNPHFLYNTLAVISAAGMEAGNNKVVSMCDSMSSILRYTVSYEETSVTLKQEIENVTCYLDLMKARYEDNFTYEIEAEDKILSMRVSKLILQPLAENCFKHGFASVEPPYFIKISIGTENQNWYIRISDNGCGFTSMDKQEINNKVNEYWRSLTINFQDMKIGGIGLANTLIRLKLNTGKDIEYTIEDNAISGSVITIRGKLE